jgi:hypothetical protein
VDIRSTASETLRHAGSSSADVVKQSGLDDKRRRVRVECQDPTSRGWCSTFLAGVWFPHRAEECMKIAWHNQTIY